LATVIAGPVKEDSKAMALIEKCVVVAEKLVADHWSSVHAVAGALLDRGRLAHADVRKIVQ
jgi:hypothetical protein